MGRRYRAGVASLPIIPYLESQSSVRYFHYAQVIAAYNLPPGVRVLVRTFDPRFLLGGDILSDFLNITRCRVPLAELRRPPAEVNVGLPLEWCETLRALNTLGQPALVERLLAAAPAVDAAGRRRLTDYYYTREVSDYIGRTFAEDNQALIERHLGNHSAEVADYWRSIPPYAGSINLDPAELGRCIAALQRIEQATE